jgi:hypothetical protein
MGDLRVSFPKPCTEQWDDMRPDSCNRHCARCDHIIHDLSQLTFEAAQQLACSGGEVCVRAEVQAGGVLKLKRGDGRQTRRMVATIGASVGILAATGQAAAAEPNQWGAIKGEILGTCMGAGGLVSATAADGRVYQAKIGRNNRYKVKRLPAGSYEVKLEFEEPQTPPDPALEALLAAPSGGKVMVGAGRTSVLNLTDPHGCIVIGMLKLENSNG